MKLAIKQEGAEIHALIKAEAAKEGIQLNELTKKLGERYDIFTRKLKAKFVEVDFVKSVLKKINKDLTLTVDRDRKGNVLLTIDTF